ncbi:MAG TPA: DUF2934 domain-containing protein [Candidatus Saccharimonadales bacterium]|nr:DUF2934 domain-containing protein [Candidatus Saccharimonadales bacterium]
MAKEKKSADKATKKTAAKKSAAPKAAAPKKSVAEEIAKAAPMASSASARTTQPSPADLYDEIRRRAYEFYRARGGQHGSHEADWHRAESEVRAKYKA